MGELLMSFDPHTIEHLGVKMYSFLPNAIAELIANSYDADATEVHIKLTDEKEEKRISVTDNGHGMSFDEINDKFLRIGRQRRKEENSTSSLGRKITGRKGLGKLAFFGIGNCITIKTIKDGKCTIFTLKWDDIISMKNTEYKPVFQTFETTDVPGTEIILSELKRKSALDKHELALSLSKLFNVFDTSFKVLISLNDDEPEYVDENLRIQSLKTQFSWEIPKDFVSSDSTYFKEKKINGKIISTEKPLKPDLKGITLFAHGRMVNVPSFFGVGESSHGYSYFTGWINVDFIDEFEEDFVSTDRQSLNWESSETEELHIQLTKLLLFIEKDWRERRKNLRNSQITKDTDIDIKNWIEHVPDSMKHKVESIVGSVISDSEMEPEKQKSVVVNLHELLPEYTLFHYRLLEESIRDAAKQDYESEDYYRAFQEAMKRFISEVQKKAELSDTDVGLMHKAFDIKKGKLSVTKKYKRKDGTDFNQNTLASIQEGQRFLSVGIMEEGRNPLAHEEIVDLESSGLFSEQDCLDFLSLLSHLSRRLKKSDLQNDKEDK